MNAPEPPRNDPAEVAVLGAVLVDSSVLDRIDLSPADFASPRHQAIFGAMVALHARGIAADFVTVPSELGARLESVGGVAYLGDLFAQVPTTLNVEHYAALVRECAVKRRVIDAGGKVAGLGFDPKLSVEEVLRQAEAFLARVDASASPTRVARLGEYLGAWWTRFGVLRDRSSGLLGLPTGLADLDRLTCGLQPGEVTIIAARPSVGKTALGLAIAQHAVAMQVPVLLFSLEMSVPLLLERLIASTSGVALAAVRTGQVFEGEAAKIEHAAGTLEGAPLFVDDRSSLTLEQVRAVGRRTLRDEGIGLVVVDYLQLVSVPGSRESRATDVAALSRGFKALAKELALPVVVLSQLNRAVESRPGRKPQLSDLRESGSIEQDADVVIFLHRNRANDDDDRRDGPLDLLLAKNRNGAIGLVSVYFDAGRQRFLPLDREGARSE